MFFTCPFCLKVLWPDDFALFVNQGYCGACQISIRSTSSLNLAEYFDAFPRLLGPPLYSARGLWLNQGLPKNLVYQLKNNPYQKQNLIILRDLLQKALPRLYPKKFFHAAVPMPMSFYKEYFFRNLWSALLAQMISEILEIPLLETQALAWKNPWQNQKKAKLKKRWLFEPSRPIKLKNPALLFPENLSMADTQALHLLLVDDVLTSGATLFKLAQNIQEQWPTLLETYAGNKPIKLYCWGLTLVQQSRLH